MQEKYQEAEGFYVSDQLNLVVAKGYLTKMLDNDPIMSYKGRNELEILIHKGLVVSTVSKEEAGQQQGQNTEMAPGYVNGLDPVFQHGRPCSPNNDSRIEK